MVAGGERDVMVVGIENEGENTSPPPKTAAATSPAVESSFSRCWSFTWEVGSRRLVVVVVVVCLLFQLRF